MKNLTLIALTAALMASCKSEPAVEDIGPHRMQRTRAGYSANGSFVSTHLLLRDSGGNPIACEEGALTATLSYSTTGPDGTFIPVAEDLQIRCPGDASGDLAVVLDNSGSTADVVATLRGASALLVDEVIEDGGRASLTRVSTNASVLHELSDDDASLIDAIVNGLRDDSNGWTALWDGVRMGNETFGGAVVHREGAVGWEDLESFCSASDRLGILAFTDGHENNSSDEQDYDHDRYPGDGFDTTFDDLTSLHVAGQTTPIYTVGLGDEPDHDELTALANATGGTHTRLSDVSEILDVFETIGDYFESTHQVCGELPEPACGTTHVKLEWTLSNGQGGIADRGETLQAVTIDCPIDPPEGRMVTVLLTMSNPDLPPADIETYVQNTVDWTGNTASPRVLVVLDDNHHNEFAGDAQYVTDILTGAGYDATLIDEPSAGLTSSDLDGYDVVWFSNPGYPVDDMASVQALAAYNASGGGVVLQGDDITWTHGHSFSMAEITGLEFVDNGVSACGTRINNTLYENYELDLVDPHPILDGLTGSTWLYSDDIDNSTPLPDTHVVAEAGVETDATCALRPVMTVRDPNE